MRKYIDVEELIYALFQNVEDLYQRGWNDALRAAINYAPAADVAPRWIPVTERLPEEDGNYLVTYTDGGVTEVGSSLYIQRVDGTEPYWDYFSVIAWASLPEPYKGGEEE